MATPSISGLIRRLVRTKRTAKSGKTGGSKKHKAPKKARERSPEVPAAPSQGSKTARPAGNGLLIEANDPCCVCGSSQSTFFFETDFPKWKYKKRFYMRRCLGCGLLFNSPRLTEGAISDHYDGNYYVFRRTDPEYFLKSVDIYERTIGVFHEEVTERRLLEVGSGKGYLLAILARLGWQVQGVELAGPAADYARAQFGTATHTGTLTDFIRTNRGTRFPVVAAVDVIEHVPDPRAFARELAEVTEPGGWLVIDTPNGNARHVEEEGADWRGFNPFHIYAFDADNLSALIGSCGFEVLRRFTYNNLFIPKDERTPPPPAPATEDPLGRAAELCRKSPGYFVSEDAQGPLAKGLRGENLVLVARRQDRGQAGRATAKG